MAFIIYLINAEAIFNQHWKTEQWRSITAIDFTMDVCECSTILKYNHWGTVKTYHLAALFFFLKKGRNMCLYKSYLF